MKMISCCKQTCQYPGMCRPMTRAHYDDKNGYCTPIGNEIFAWFSSTESKSCINFLSYLGQDRAASYVLSVGALTYMEQQKRPPVLFARLEGKTVHIETQADWESWLENQGVNSPRHRKIITEGALMGGLLAQGISVNFSIISDDAGQFNVFDHALCWIHAERIINCLIPLNDEHIKAIEAIREQLWSIYHDLKVYKLNPVPEPAETLKLRFQVMCRTETGYATLNQALKRMGNNQHELLRVLDKPYLPLHNDLSDRDIREYVKKSKISGSTRSDAGRQCRATLASLKKTCLILLCQIHSRAT